MHCQITIKLLYDCIIGIVENEIDSWFSYNPGDSYDTFFDPFFEPVFQPDFSNNTDLEKEAKMICGDDTFCLFDIATTKRTEIGATTLIDSENFEDMLNSSEPSQYNVDIMA